MQTTQELTQPQQAQVFGSGLERRQFADSRHTEDPDVRELAEAIDVYKFTNHRKYITLVEVLQVAKSLGYHK